MYNMIKEAYEFSKLIKKLDEKTEVDMDEFIKECRFLGEQLGIVTENICREHDLKFCQMCFEKPAIKGESLCEDCKKGNEEELE